MRIVHVTSVHSAHDNRIFYKECVSLAKRGIEVHLVAPHDRDVRLHGVQIHGINPSVNRRDRLFNTTRRVFRKALSLDGDIYHLHDPELIIIGLLLKMHRKEVVFDIHEDYVSSISQKPYLPRMLRSIAGRVFGIIEGCAYKHFALVLAEKYYSIRFPSGITVLNYPSETLFQSFPKPVHHEDTLKHHFIYTGNVTRDRGAINHAQIVSLLDEVEVHLFGKRDQAIKNSIRSAAALGINRLHLRGDGSHQPFSAILDGYTERSWTAGLAIFPHSEHYVNKELTKFFEYMAVGIPIIASDFPAWRSLLEPVGCAIFVKPDEPSEIAEAVHWLIDNPTQAKQMGLAGYTYVRDHFRWESQVDKLVHLYHELLT